jgi:hypothetical protein
MRRLVVVRVDMEVPQSAESRGEVARAGCRRAASLTTGYLVRGCRLLGLHSTAFVWTTESGDPPSYERSGSA